MTAALLLAGLMLAQAPTSRAVNLPAVVPAPDEAATAPAPPTLQEHLQLRAENEALKFALAKERRRVAELLGLADYLGAGESQRLGASQQALAEALKAAGLVLNDQGQVVKPPDGPVK